MELFGLLVGEREGLNSRFMGPGRIPWSIYVAGTEDIRGCDQVMPVEAGANSGFTNADGASVSVRMYLANDIHRRPFE